MEHLRRDWGERLRAAREKAGLTQVDLALAVGVTQMSVSAYELGRRTPSDAARMRLAEALRCRVDDLFPYPESTTTPRS